uniref:Terpene synthase n=1 Tax=Erythrolobus australicus TaxID=1077150 RepID=A0A3S9GV71_9RHOD|nr:terpene synthase 1 [Erythrolobus australicus]
MRQTQQILSFDPMVEHGSGRPLLRGKVLRNIHPGEARAFRESLDWVVDCGITEVGSVLYAKFQQARFSALAALVYPYATSEQLVWLSKFVVFLFAYDDVNDDREQLVQNPTLDGELEMLEESLMSIARGSRPRGAEQPLARAFADFMAEFQRYASDDWLACFADDVEDYLLANRMERKVHVSDNVMKPADYIPCRRSLSACRAGFDVGAALLGIDCAKIRSSEIARVMATLGNDHFSWLNDLFGIDRDLKQGTASNLIICLAAHTTHDLHHALDMTVNMLNETCTTFFELEHSEHVRADPDVRLYSQIVRSSIVGTLSWYYRSERYNAAHAKQH